MKRTLVVLLALSACATERPSPNLTLTRNGIWKHGRYLAAPGSWAFQTDDKIAAAMTDVPSAQTEAVRAAWFDRISTVGVFGVALGGAATVGTFALEPKNAPWGQDLLIGTLVSGAIILACGAVATFQLNAALDDYNSAHVSAQ
jgi:hypothetical protein